MSMTVQELYNFAKERNVLDYEIEILCPEDRDWYSRAIDEDNIEIEDDLKTITI